jgi:hypothetical protein
MPERTALIAIKASNKKRRSRISVQFNLKQSQESYKIRAAAIEIL